MLYSIVRSRILGVIPARFASSRFPGKALAKIAGKSMLQHVWERASLAQSLTCGVLVATDDERIAAEVRRFGGRVRITRPDHRFGTDRLAEVASAEFAHIYVNIQGDEPAIDPDAINCAVWAAHGDEHASLGTLKRRLEDPSDLANPNVVKVVTNLAGLRRNPFPRVIPSPMCVIRVASAARVLQACRAVCIPARSLLLAYPDLPVGPLERAECLEQLRALENGYRIKVIETEYESLGVDSPDDLERISRLFQTANHKLQTSVQDAT